MEETQINGNIVENGLSLMEIGVECFCYEIDEFLIFFFVPKRNLKGSMNFWAFWSTNSGWVGGFVAQETKNLKKCDLDLNK